jgi:hypothetical protein
MRMYKQYRLKDNKIKFTKDFINLVWKSYPDYKFKISSNNPLLLFGKRPPFKFDKKGDSDYYAISLWNEIFHNNFRITSVDQIKDSAERYIKYYDAKFPNGYGSNMVDDIKYITANSSSSFIGIQKPGKSSYSYDSMISTLRSHARMDINSRPWLLDNLNFLKSHLQFNPNVMNRDYGEICLNARTSSSSIKGHGSYRDYVLEHTLDEIVQNLHGGVPYVIYAGTRADRRGKYRLIFSMDANFRVVDFLINNGSYSLCQGNGILSNYTTEGFNGVKMWQSMKDMSKRGDYGMICLDYKGYDTQISMDEYRSISMLLNEHRMHDNEFMTMFQKYIDWIDQPKPLLIKSHDKDYEILPLVGTLASGLHGTHSFENLIGISTFIQSKSEGIRSDKFWTNGDDQNVRVHSNDIDKFIRFIEKYFIINWSKSLVSHKFAVWGKMWFSEDVAPTVEIGTFRSIWEKEGGDVSYVEESKFENNYLKIIQVIIILINLNKSQSTIERWMEDLCDQSVPKINPYLLPKRLNNLMAVKDERISVRNSPKGLESAKSYLLRKNFDLKLFNISNYYDMLDNMYRNRTFFTLDINNVEYYPNDTALYIESGFDYSRINMNVPYMFQKMIDLRKDTPERTFVSRVLQGTKSYDGISHKSYEFRDMLSLSAAINNRNKHVWKSMH